MADKTTSLGDRMKNNYENRYRTYLPRRTYVIIRLDGKNFHSYTKNANKPFDSNLIRLFDETTKYLCTNIQGCKLGYTQSDEISLLLTDFDTIDTQAWYDNNLQKMVSVSASMATAQFNHLTKLDDTKFQNQLAMFDSRIWIIPDPIEVENYLIWRQQDCTRNSVSMAAQAVCSHKELQGKKSSEMQEMMFQKAGINWDKYSSREKRGCACVRSAYFEDVERHRWDIVDTPIFTQERDFLRTRIPRIEL